MATALKKETLRFLKDLAHHNDRAWFAKNKERYLAANEDFTAFVGTLIAKVAAFDRNVAGLDPKDCIFRIYRDIRFSKDKSPYKTAFAAALMGKKRCSSGYYVHVAPGDAFLAGGYHMVEPAELAAIRRRISADGKTFLAILRDAKFRKAFTLDGERLANVPRGFAKDDPMAEYLRYKEMTVRHDLKDSELTSAGFAERCAATFKTMSPLTRFVNGAR